MVTMHAVAIAITYNMIYRYTGKITIPMSCYTTSDEEKLASYIAM